MAKYGPSGPWLSVWFPWSVGQGICLRIGDQGGAPSVVTHRNVDLSSADAGVESVSVRVTSTDVGIERAIVRVESADFGVETVNVRVQNADFGVKNVNVHVKNVHFSRTVIMSSVGQVTGQRRIAPLYRSFREPPDIQRGLFRRKAPF